MSKRKSTDVGVSPVSANKKICEEQKPLPKTCLRYGLDVESETNCIAEIDRDTINCLLPSGHRELLLDGRCSNISLKPLLIAAAWG